MQRTLPFFTRLLKASSVHGLLFRGACSIAITAEDVAHSNYHRQGPLTMQAPHLVEMVIGEHLETITGITGQMEQLRGSLSSPQVDRSWDQYVSLFGKLASAVGRCQLRHQWVASLIAWYNLTPLYPALLEQLL